jgi:hypothetical protein
MVTGRAFDPRSELAHRIMKIFHADPLYRKLCLRQGCFRARLTPKPHRLKCRTHKVEFPRNDPERQKEHNTWLAEYDNARSGFSTCRLICSLGHAVRDKVIDFHDKETGATVKRKLA